MRIIDIIAKKRDGLSLDAEEIRFVVNGYTAGQIPDYQMSAWLMAVFLQGMTREETAALTLSMAASGRQMDLSAVPGIKVDKHSTGGVGDTTTLVLAPLLAAAGVPVAKMSGRGLGFTGGTIDKLEALSGLNTGLSEAEFIRSLAKIQLAITGQSADIAPADGKMYALRDVTSTIESIPLIASSIMSKKIAAGADKILLDVKVGSGAFMKTLPAAIELAETMVEIGKIVGRETKAIISSMEEPLGQAVGNSLEVAEALEILNGGLADSPLRHVCLLLGAHMLYMAGAATSLVAGYGQLEKHLADGSALAKFAALVTAQGGDAAVVYNPALLPIAQRQVEICSAAAGVVQQIDAAQIGYAAMRLGAGREVKGQSIDLSAGLVLKCRRGETLAAGQVIAVLHVNDETKLLEAQSLVTDAIKIAPQPVSPLPLVLGVVDESGFLGD